MPNHDVQLIISDFRAKVGNVAIAGKDSIHQISNENGKIIIDLADGTIQIHAKKNINKKGRTNCYKIQEARSCEIRNNEQEKRWQEIGSILIITTSEVVRKKFGESSNETTKPEKRC